MQRSVRQKVVRLAVVGAAWLAVPSVVFAQGGGVGTLQGKVLDAGSQQPLAGTQVFVAGGKFGTVTNASGEYRIPNVPAGSADVRARLIGYAPFTKAAIVVAGQSTTLNIELSQSAITLSEVVTTGAGAATEEKKLGNTVAKVDVRDLAFSPIQSPSEILQGRIPGVSSLPSGGITGEGTRIRIRGNASLSQSNEPVYYVDGIRMDAGGGFGSLGEGGGSPSRIDDIDPASIERIEVLKGAAAATLYGTEASNGVVQIFTKKGSAGTPRYSLNLERSAVKYPDRIEPIYGFSRSQAQADSLSRFYGRTITPYQLFSARPADQLLETGYGNTVSASVNGGTQAATYYIAGRYQFEDGPFTNGPLGGLTADVARKYQGTLSVTLSPRDNLHLGFRSLYTDSHNQIPPNNNNTFAPFPNTMESKPELANCNAGSFPGDPTYGIRSPGVCLGAGNPTGATAFATLRETLQEKIIQDAAHFNGVFSGNLLMLGSVLLDGTFGLDYTDARNSTFLPFGNALDGVSVRDPNGQRNLDNVITQNITLDVKGTWTKNLNRSFNSTLVAGAQGFISQQNENTSFSHEFAGPGLEVVGAGIDFQATETFLKNVNAGYFAQEQLGFRDWTFLTVGGRYDRNSAFGESAGGVFYPKVSLSIVPSDRAGWTNQLLSTVRLRAAYGKSGRQPGAFDKFTTYQALGGGLVPANLGNQDLKPEVSTEWEVGAETGFLSDKMSLSYTFWNRTVNDALVSKQFPLTSGFIARQLANIGELKAHGSEVGIKAFVLNRPNVALDVFANGAYIYQNVASMGGAAPIKVGGSYPRYRNFLKEGMAPGALLGAKLMAPCSSYSNPTTQALGGCLQPGQVPVDLNGDHKPDTEAELLNALRNPLNPSSLVPLIADDNGNGDPYDHYLGKPYPDWQGAFGANIRFLANWRVSTMFEYKAGNYTITDLTYAFRNSHPVIGRNTQGAASTELTLLNPASTPEQRVVAAEKWLHEYRALNEFGLNQNGNGDFLRWREVNLTYSAPAKMASRFGVRDLAVTMGVRNLMLWTKYTGIDPESNAIGRGGNALSGSNLDNNYLDAVDIFGFPIPRRFTFSVRVGF